MKNPSLNARQLADQLLFPGAIDGGLASGVFVQVSSNEESSQFFWDLAPMLEAGGMLVEVIDAANIMVRNGLPRLAQLLRARCGGECAPASGMGELTLADTLADVMHNQSNTLVLLLGGAQRLPGEPGERAMKAIKAARDRINLAPASTGRLLLVATWVLPSNPSKYVENSSSAFYGATAVTLAQSR
ncbi:hypothetical protein [Pseudoduganella sp. UC29_71]|uniref:hypothetical protein n=1 Tax=Pseudoduganella sp. UC29_71 TaxID=3350174 RepID=UPI00366D18E0